MKTFYEKRLTYIYMYVSPNDDIKYIFNRSIDYDNIISSSLANVLKAIGENYYYEQVENICSSLNKIYLGNNIKILETHPEWPNIKHCNQKEINKRKNELAKEHNAYVINEEILKDNALDIVDKTLKDKLKNHLMQRINNIDKNMSAYKKHSEAYIDIDKLELEISEKEAHIERLNETISLLVKSFNRNIIKKTEEYRDKKRDECRMYRDECRMYREDKERECKRLDQRMKNICEQYRKDE